MKIIIDISEKCYNDIQSKDWKNTIWTDEVTRAIHEGTVLPEHHGRLIDADELKDMFKYTEDADYCRWTLPGAIREIDDAPTILEATEVDHE